MTPDDIVYLRDPRNSLPVLGTVQDQKTSAPARYDPYALTDKLQATMLHYAAEPPVSQDGQMLWLVVLGPRQGGKSTCAELVFYPLAAYSPGWDHVCIADTQDRADYLHTRVQFNHDAWPDEYRVPQKNETAYRKLTFEHGGGMRVASGEKKAVGIGQSPDSFHGSELAFWRDPEEQWTYLMPSMLNRDNARMILECTPAPLDTSSAQWWRDKCDEAARGEGRHIFAFFPFWDTKLCRRIWNPDWTPDQEELGLMNDYGMHGLTWENLAFRRAALATDSQLRKNPELFPVFYPFDPVTCWLTGSGGIIPQHLVAAAHRRTMAWDSRGGVKIEGWIAPDERRGIKGDTYREFLKPAPGATYLVCGDPAGWGAKDHASFHVFECWDDVLEQAAVFSAPCDPASYGEALLQAALRFNGAMIAVERNGVGAGAITYIQAKGYRNIYHDAKFKPGVHKSSHDQMLTVLTDELEKRLILHDQDTYAQLLSYRGDKLIERSQYAEIASGGKDGNAKRRPRHHWDKVSALAIGCIAVKNVPTRVRVKLEKRLVTGEEAVATFNAWESYVKSASGPSRPPSRAAARGYRSRRGRR